MPPKKTAPFKNYKEWSTSRFWSFIRSALRSAWTRYPVKYELLRESRIKVEGCRHKFEYVCSICHKQGFLQKEIVVDHINPAGQLKEYSDLPRFVEQLFCGIENLQIVCHPCHKIKNKEDRARAYAKYN